MGAGREFVRATISIRNHLPNPVHWFEWFSLTMTNPDPSPVPTPDSVSVNSADARRISAGRKATGRAGIKQIHPGVGFGSNLAVGLALCCYIGYKADLRFDSYPIGLLVGMVIGFIYGGYELWKLLHWIQENESMESPGNQQDEVVSAPHFDKLEGK